MMESMSSSKRQHIHSILGQIENAIAQLGKMLLESVTILLMVISTLMVKLYFQPFKTISPLLPKLSIF